MFAPAVITSHTPAEWAEMQVSLGKPSKISVPAWLEDLAAGNKAIMLCEWCARKYPAFKFGYRRQRLSVFTKHCRGKCDGHHEMALCGLYMPANGVRV